MSISPNLSRSNSNSSFVRVTPPLSPRTTNTEIKPPKYSRKQEIDSFIQARDEYKTPEQMQQNFQETIKQRDELSKAIRDANEARFVEENGKRVFKPTQQATDAYNKAIEKLAAFHEKPIFAPNLKVPKNRLKDAEKRLRLKNFAIRVKKHAEELVVVARQHKAKFTPVLHELLTKRLKKQ